MLDSLREGLQNAVKKLVEETLLRIFPDDLGSTIEALKFLRQYKGDGAKGS